MEKELNIIDVEHRSSHKEKLYDGAKVNFCTFAHSGSFINCKKTSLLQS